MPISVSGTTLGSTVRLKIQGCFPHLRSTVRLKIQGWFPHLRSTVRRCETGGLDERMIWFNSWCWDDYGGGERYGF